MRTQVDRPALQSLVDALRDTVTQPGRLFLIGETSQLAEDWRPRVSQLLLTSGGDDGAREATTAAVQTAASRLGMRIVWESPEDVVPLPDGADQRHRATEHTWSIHGGIFEILHYDPYSVICRGIARGDEPDYHTALAYLEHGWVTEARLVELFEGLIPRLSAESIAQDPAEFRRKLKGLLQMWRAQAGERAMLVEPETGTTGGC